MLGPTRSSDFFDCLASQTQFLRSFSEAVGRRLSRRMEGEAFYSRLTSEDEETFFEAPSHRRGSLPTKYHSDTNSVGVGFHRAGKKDKSTISSVRGFSTHLRKGRPRQLVPSRGPKALPLSDFEEESESHIHGRVGFYCLANSLDLKALVNFFRSQKMKPSMYHDVVHLRYDHDGYPEGESCHGFFFPYGAVVFWGMTAAMEAEKIENVMQFFDALLDDSEKEVDDIEYSYGSKSTIFQDSVMLETTQVAEKVAVSIALAQSIRLAVYEESVVAAISDARHIPENLANTGLIQLSRRELSQKIGELFIERSQINLHSDMLDTPEYFWEYDEWEPRYSMVQKYMDIAARVDVLNRRLDVMKELYDMLSNEINNQHSTKLEWIVIILIVIECLLQLLSLFLGAFHK